MSMFDAIFSNSENKKTTFVLGAVLVVIIVLALVTYIFFYNDDTAYDDLDFALNDASAFQNLGNGANAPIVEESITPPPPAIESANVENVNTNVIAQNTAPAIESSANNIDTISSAQTMPAQTTPAQVLEPSVATKPSTISQLQYTIKPLNKNITNCHTMRNGKWVMPESCGKDIVESVQNLIDTNKELIALEVIGIVDNNPYAGPSAELKQEGLASFRAREAIRLITRNFSSIAVFEGLSVQAPNKRGFEIKAYYLQK